jgi:hypothetical protein
MIAIFMGLQTLVSNKTNTHICIMYDNTTAVNVPNNINELQSLAREIWEWHIERELWISVAHIPGKNNLIADYESRRNQRESKWMIDKTALTLFQIYTRN